MKKIILSVSIFLFTAASAYADFDSAKWQYAKEIRVSGSQNLASFTIDNQVYEHANENLSDLRIIDANGQEIKYKLSVERESRELETLSLSVRDLATKEGEYTQFVADLGREGQLHNSITILTNSVNFRRQVEVESSKDGQSWLLVKRADEGGYVYDYSLDFKAKNTAVYYPQSTSRYLRIKILDNGDDPIKVSGATAINDIYFGARTTNLTPQVLETRQDKDKQTTIYLLDLGARGIPSNRLKFSTADTNFNREVLIEGSNDKSSFTLVGRDVIFSYDTPKFSGEKGTLNFPEGNFRYLRLTVFNRDNPAISLSTFESIGNVRKVVFENKKGALRLFYGNSSARFPDYDIGAYLAYYSAGDVSPAVLGQEATNGSFEVAKAAQKPLTERYPYLLPGVLAVAVLILGSLIARLAIAVKRSR